MTSKKILFLSPYPKDKAPSQRLKYEQYFNIFRENGFAMENDSFISIELWQILYKKGHFLKKIFLTLLAYIRRYKTLLYIHNYDIIYIHLWGTPFGFPIYEKLLRLTSKKLIYDIDDMIFLKDTNQTNKISGFLKGKQKSIYLMKKADHVITCTQKLDDFTRKYNPNTTNISSTVDTRERYMSKDTYEINRELIIGWSGSYTTSRFLYILSDVLKALSGQINFKLLVMGDETFQLDGVNLEAVKWEETIEMPTLKRFDIGLYPLSDEPWVYGKSGLKAIQYMALGIPTIATGIGANFGIINDGINGFLIPPSDQKLWEKRILELFNDAGLRKRIGESGRETVVKKFSIESNKNKYLQILENLS